jgi:hypothetical protein
MPQGGAPPTVSPVYARINEYLLPDGARAISEYAVALGDIDRYELIAPIGSGRYSVVFLARGARGPCAVKVLRAIAFSRIRRELFILARLAGVPGVVRVLDVNVDALTGAASIVTNYVAAECPRALYARLALRDVALYAQRLLAALDGCHARGVMHRDIKPGNVCIDHARRELCVIDWGLADLYYPRARYSVRVSTLRYKAPELLLGYAFYDYGVDVWGAGSVMGGRRARRRRNDRPGRRALRARGARAVHRQALVWAHAGRARSSQPRRRHGGRRGGARGSRGSTTRTQWTSCRICSRWTTQRKSRPRRRSSTRSSIQSERRSRGGRWARCSVREIMGIKAIQAMRQEKAARSVASR